MTAIGPVLCQPVGKLFGAEDLIAGIPQAG